MISKVALLLLGLTTVLVALYSHVANNVEKYANSGNRVARAIILISGFIFGALGALLFFENVAEPTWAYGSGFLLGPLLAIAACIYLVVGALFPLQEVRALLKYSFRHKLNDDIRQ